MEQVKIKKQETLHERQIQQRLQSFVKSLPQPHADEKMPSIRVRSQRQFSRPSKFLLHSSPQSRKTKFCLTQNISKRSSPSVKSGKDQQTSRRQISPEYTKVTLREIALKRIKLRRLQKRMSREEQEDKQPAPQVPVTATSSRESSSLTCRVGAGLLQKLQTRYSVVRRQMSATKVRQHMEQMLDKFKTHAKKRDQSCEQTIYSIVDPFNMRLQPKLIKILP